MSWQETEKRCRGRLKSCLREEFGMTFDLLTDDGNDTHGGNFCCFYAVENPGGGE